MAFVASSNLITNDDTSPRTLNDVGLIGGRVRCAKGYVTLPTTALDTNTDTWGLASLPTNARIEGIWLKNTDLDTNATETLELDVGVYSTTGTAKAAAVYFDGSVNGAAAFEDANLSWVDVFYRAADAASSRLWQDAGDTTDPGGFYTIGVLVKIVAATPAQGTVEFKIHYTID